VPTNYTERCNGCPYRQGNAQYQAPGAPLSMEGGGAARALLVLQAPGVEEWAARRPAISQCAHSAAARLRNSMTRIGRTRADYGITNAVQCYPGRSADGRRDKRPWKAARRACAVWLRDDIEMRNWDRVVVFGRVAECSVRMILSPDQLDAAVFRRHPSGGLTNDDLDAALSH